MRTLFVIFASLFCFVSFAQQIQQSATASKKSQTLKSQNVGSQIFKNPNIKIENNQIVENIKLTTKSDGAKQNSYQETGQINWTQNLVKAEGVAYLNPDHVSETGRDYAIDMAVKGAETIGKRNLLSIIDKVRIVDTILVLNAKSSRQITIETINGSIRASREGDPVVNGNRVKVVMVCDISNNSSLQGALTEPFAPKGRLSSITNDQVEQAQQDGLDVNLLTQGLNLLVNPSQQTNLNPSLLSRIRVVDKEGKTIWTNFTGGINTGNEKANHAIQLAVEAVKNTGALDGTPVKIDPDGTVVINVLDIISEDAYSNLIKTNKLMKWLPFILAAGKLVLTLI